MNQMAMSYIENRIRNASPIELVLILYEGTMQQLAEAKAAIEQQSVERKTNAINRASRFIAELQASLNMEVEGGISPALSRLYEYFRRRLVEANLTNSVPILQELLDLMRTLYDSWVQIARQMQPQVADMASSQVETPPADPSQRLNLSI